MERDAPSPLGPPCSQGGWGAVSHENGPLSLLRNVCVFFTQKRVKDFFFNAVHSSKTTHARRSNLRITQGFPPSTGLPPGAQQAHPLLLATRGLRESGWEQPAVLQRGGVSQQPQPRGCLWAEPWSAHAAH